MSSDRVLPTKLPDSTFWLALEHSCGCVIDWGCDSRQHKELCIKFFPTAVSLPCPFHQGCDELIPEKIYYHVNSNLFYQVAEGIQIENGRSNRNVALKKKNQS